MLGPTDDAIYMPLTTLRQTVNAQRTTSGAYTVNQIIVSVTDRKYLQPAKNEITVFSRPRIGCQQSRKTTSP